MRPATKHVVHWRGLTCLLALSIPLTAAGAGMPLEPPPAPIVNEAQALVQQMIRDERGPYYRIRWFCSDGTEQPPVAYACRERGGGRQHASYSPQRARLSQLGWNVGTIFAALEWQDLWDADNRQDRLRELALERYLIDVDDGWVLRRAAGYRGRVQVEDEEAAGRALLLQLLSDRIWVEQNYLLARESVRVIPHGDDSDIAREIRREALELAELAPTFQPLRAEIHSAPSQRTAARVRAWAVTANGVMAEIALELADDLDELFGAVGRHTRMRVQADLLRQQAEVAYLASALDIDPVAAPAARLSALVGAMNAIYETIGETRSAAVRLALFDVISDLEAETILTAAEALADTSLSRAALIELGLKLAIASRAAGVLTTGELQAITRQIAALDNDAEISLGQYKSLTNLLRRVPYWASGTVRNTFAGPLIRYAALEPRAGQFVDDLLRGSALFPLAEITRRLSRDADRLSGVTLTLFGESAPGLYALNAGTARGRLRVFADSGALASATLDRGDVVVLPETIAELPPVAGILTLGEGNPLSHVQLLARNFGIPNVAVEPSTLPLLREQQGREVVLIATTVGSVSLFRAENMPAEIDDLLQQSASNNATRFTVPVPDLAADRLIPLSELNRSLSGKVVGPKAANLGQLNRLFPGRVAPALAVPFGIFAAHMNVGDPSLRSRLVEAYRLGEAGDLNGESLLLELDAIRAGIAELQLRPDTRAELTVMMAELFGPPGAYGVFIRSDTNVEDLPQFTGAGLSETLANVVGLEAQLDSIPRVWSSVLSPRAIAWRSSVLTNPDQIYASVLVMKSVPSEKSGVLVTANLSDPVSSGITVSTSWGIGGAVAGEAAETLVLDDDREILVSEAKAPLQRVLNPAGGLDWLPANPGPVLTAPEKMQIKILADEVSKKYQPVFDDFGNPRPWDVEFGFVDGELTLFQIRPLVEKGQKRTDKLLQSLLPAPDPALRLIPVNLGLPPEANP